MDFSQYVPPGTYIEDTTVPVVTSTGLANSVVAIVGPALGYQLFTESIVIPASGSVPLVKKNVYTAASGSIPAPVVTRTSSLGALGGLTVGVDYVFSTSAADSQGNVAVSVSTGSGGTTGLVSITYAYTDANYYTPLTFNDFDTLVGVYGLPLVETTPSDPTASQVHTPLSFAAMLAFTNGASSVICVATNPGLRVGGNPSTFQQQLADGYGKILTMPQIGIVVPVFEEGSASASDLHTFSIVKSYVDDVVSHVVSATNQGFPRIAVVGMTPTFGATGGQNEGDLATAENNKRLVIAYPNAVNFYNGYVNSTTVVGGTYLAAALAGRLAANPAQKPLTKEVIRSFAGLPANVQALQTRSFKDGLSKQGVAVAELDRNSALSVRHGVTTAMGSLTTREISIVRARDLLFELLQQGVDNAGLVGTPITDQTPANIKSLLTGILERARTDGVITSYTNLAVRQQTLPTGDPTVIEAKFAYQPAVPLNYIVVSFQINLSNGQIDTSSSTSADTTDSLSPQ